MTTKTPTAEEIEEAKALLPDALAEVERLTAIIGDDDSEDGSSPKPTQLTAADVKKLAAAGKHLEIVKAKEAGRLDDYLNS